MERTPLDQLSSRRSVLERGAGLLALLSLGLAGAGTAAGRSPAGPTAGPAPSPSWTRLYQGTATVTITYLTALDREATGELPVDVRFAPPETLVTGGPPFQFRLDTGEPLRGNLVVQENPNPYSTAPPLVEGSVRIETETGTGSTFERPVQAWAVTYDERTGQVQGALVVPSEPYQIANSVVALEPFLGDYLLGYRPANTQSRLEGTVGEDALSLRFDLVDVNQTLTATVEVTADRRV